MDGVELNVYMCNLMLAAVSSLQTMDNCMSLINNDNKSLSTFIKLYLENI